MIKDDGVKVSLTIKFKTSVAGVFGYCLGALRHCVLCELTGKEESDCGLDLSTGES